MRRHFEQEGLVGRASLRPCTATSFLTLLRLPFLGS